MDFSQARDQTIADLQISIQRFNRWLETEGFASYDPYDIWGTAYGLFARRLYYQRNPLGVPLIAPILLLEMVAPRLRGLFVRKQQFATADGQLLLAYLNLYAVTRDESCLATARRLGDELLKLSIPGFSGHCWGYPFDWQNNRGLWRRNTPFITATPYCYEAFAGLFDATGEDSFRNVAVSAAKFVYQDLKDTPTGPGAAASSYGPHDDSQVINASAYRAFVLFHAARRFGLEDYLDKARANLKFILQNQRPDGSWYYAVNSPGKPFIDNFHTCFVIKSLVKIHRLWPGEVDWAAVERGYAYYRQALFDHDDQPKSFAVEPRTQIVKLEMYNMAEGITLGALLGERIPDARSLAIKLAGRLREQYQLPAGHFVTRVFLGGLRHTLPFLRWPQAQLFYSLTNLLKALSDDGVAVGAAAESVAVV